MNVKSQQACSKTADIHFNPNCILVILIITVVSVVDMQGEHVNQYKQLSQEIMILHKCKTHIDNVHLNCCQSRCMNTNWIPHVNSVYLFIFNFSC